MMHQTDLHSKMHFKFRYGVLALIICFIILTQQLPSWGRFYAYTLYPTIATALSWLTSWFSFPLNDIIITVAVLWVILYPFLAHFRRHRKAWHIVVHEVEFLLWIYGWFYLAWGLNYAQPSFYERMDVPYKEYSDSAFTDFTHRYVQAVNEAYTPDFDMPEDSIVNTILLQYERYAEELHIHRPFHRHLRSKKMLFSSLASKVGVGGSMGPFCCESTVNRHVLPMYYPATCAHELSHLLGIANEAEANFYAYQVCTRSAQPELRYSGYLFLLPHVLHNVRSLCGKEAYEKCYRNLRPEVIADAQRNQAYWHEAYSPLIGGIQDFIYDLYLKQNHIASGCKNYSEVIGLLIAYEAEQK